MCPYKNNQNLFLFLFRVRLVGEYKSRRIENENMMKMWEDKRNFNFLSWCLVESGKVEDVKLFYLVE